MGGRGQGAIASVIWVTLSKQEEFGDLSIMKIIIPVLEDTGNPPQPSLLVFMHLCREWRVVGEGSLSFMVLCQIRT